MHTKQKIKQLFAQSADKHSHTHTHIMKGVIIRY